MIKVELFVAGLAAAMAQNLPHQLPAFNIADGVEMPAVSVGHPDSGCEHGVGPGCAQAAYNETYMWLSLGGRGIDTAFEYKNQANIGEAVADAIKAGIANRSSIFITTKIVPAICTEDAALSAVKVDIQQLGVDYVDLMLLHFPCATDAGNQAMWTGLNQAKKLGLTRAIGVSHFSASDLENIGKLGLDKPAVNQCEMCVGSHDDATINYCKSNGITYEAYGALRNINFSNPELISIAKAHNVSVAQVALRWVTQNDVPIAVSPGLNKEYAFEDLDLNTFNLSSSEMTILSKI